MQALDQLGHHTDIWNKEVKDTWQTFFRVITRIMKKGYSRQHPVAAIVFVRKGGTDPRLIVPKPLAVEQKNLITEVILFLRLIKYEYQPLIVYFIKFQKNIVHV